MKRLGFGPVDLIVPGPALEQTRLRKLVGSCLAWPGDPMHRMNHMAGWATLAALAMSGGVGSNPLKLLVERERGVLPGTIRCGHSSRAEIQNGIWLAVSACVKGEPLDASEHQPDPGVYRD